MPAHPGKLSSTLPPKRARSELQSFLVDVFTAGGHPQEPSDFAAAIQKVTAEDVKGVVDMMLNTNATLVHFGESAKAPILADLA